MAANIITRETDINLRHNQAIIDMNRVQTYHFISRCTAIPQSTRRIRTTGMAAIVTPNSAEFFDSTTINSYLLINIETFGPKRMGQTCIVIPVKAKKSNFKRQIMI